MYSIDITNWSRISCKKNTKVGNKLWYNVDDDGILRPSNY